MFKKILKVTIILIVLVLVGVQFYRPDFTNPPIAEAETIQASTQIPGDVREILSRSCNDCHSNETAYPWYSKVTPFNWFLHGHIDAGRHELNFSVWNSYSKEKKMRKLDEICEQVESGAMPLPSYLWIHGDAVLTRPDAERLCGWAKAERERIAAGNF
jgi:Haem-binding domain